MESAHFGGHPQWHLWGLVFNSDTLLTSWLVSAVLIIFAICVKYKLIKRPGIFQSMVEMGIESMEDMMHERLGAKGAKYLPFAATLLLFILLSNWLGVLPFDLKSPTADLNTTVGLALLTIFLVQIFGMFEKGLFRSFHRFVEPHFLFLPLNIVEEIAKPFSLSIRLFGNIFSKETILFILTGLVAIPLFYPIPILALSIMIGAIQAYVFMLLSVFYISMAIEGH